MKPERFFKRKSRIRVAVACTGVSQRCIQTLFTPERFFGDFFLEFKVRAMLIFFLKVPE